MHAGVIKPLLHQTARLARWTSEATIGFIQDFNSQTPLAFFQQKALKYTTTVSAYCENPFKTRNRLHPWVSSNLTNGQEAEVSVAHRTCHSWLSSNAIWAPSLHNIPVKMKTQKRERKRQVRRCNETWRNKVYRRGQWQIRSHGVCVAFRLKS